MASDSPGDGSVSVSLPESLGRWLEERAAAEGRPREDVLLELLSAYRTVEGVEDGDVDLPDGMVPDDGLTPELEAAVEEHVDRRVERRLEELLADRLDERLDGHLDDRIDERLDAVARKGAAAETDATDLVDAETLDERMSAAESRFMELLEDVRDRVVQVKRETDGKAPADHDHPDLAREAAVEAVADDVAALSDAVDALDDRLAAGFDNYEAVLESLADDVDRGADRRTTLARALVETREELRTLAARDAARSAAESLRREANEHGVRTADCGECGETVDVGLLDRAECPHCATPLVGVEPARGFFGSNELVTGDRPALAAGADDGGYDHDVGAIVDEAEGAGEHEGAGDHEGAPTVDDESDEDAEGSG